MTWIQAAASAAECMRLTRVRGSHERDLVEATRATWSQRADIQVQYRSVSALKNRRVVFNIKGSVYRLIVAMI